MKLRHINNTKFKISQDLKVFFGGHFITQLDDINDFEDEIPDLIISSEGVEYFSENVRNPHDIFCDVDLEGELLYKATNNLESPQVPGFCSDDLEDIQQYLPSGRRYGKYGGKHLVKFICPPIGVYDESDSFITANQGLVLMLPGARKAIDFGGNDGLAIFELVELIN